MAKLIGLLKKDFKRDGQSLSEFAAEFKELTPQDRDDFRRWYREMGVEVEDGGTT